MPAGEGAGPSGQFAAISGALTLLANILMGWNARRMDDALRRRACAAAAMRAPTQPDGAGLAPSA